LSSPVGNPVLLDLPASIATDRLLLRPPQSGDGAAVLEAIAESLPQLRRFLASLPWVAGEQSVASSEAWARTAAANFAARKDFPFLIFVRDSGRLIGATGLHRVDWSVPKAEVGYWCRTSCHGQGFITEAVSAMVGYAFEHFRAVRVEIVTDEENEPSRRVALRSGFTLEGTLRHQCRAPDGALRNMCVYARLRDS
jgi:RimJ/RimL family protein N-acetyltransferase